MMFLRRSYSQTHKLQQYIEKEIANIKSAGTWKSERIIVSKQGPQIRVSNQSSDILNFCANNYLGLASHPKVIESAVAAVKSHGSGLSSVRFICGTTDLHSALEEKLCQFHGKQAAILYPSCFDANGGIFEGLLTDEDAVISDELNHASIIDGVRLCKAKRWRYKNGDTADLEKCLKEADKQRIKLIATDGVFSMDGKIAPLRSIASLANKYGAVIFVDDCHATGFIGQTGRGTEQYWNLTNNEIDIVNSTLGKALGGSMGGYTVGPKYVVDILRQRSRPYLFSNTLPPGVVGSAMAALDLVMNDTDGLIAKIQSNTKQFREQMKGHGFSISGDDCHPICPVMLGDARLATEFSDKMLKRGIYVIGFSYPVVPKDKARIRVQISAVHTTEHINAAVDAFKSVGLELGVIKKK